AVAKANALLTHARVTAQDAKAPEGDRLAALRVLGRSHGRRGHDLEILGGLVAPQNAATVQAAALAALAQIPGDQSAAVIIGGWGGYSPALKTQALDALLSR